MINTSLKVFQVGNLVPKKSLKDCLFVKQPMDFFVRFWKFGYSIAKLSQKRFGELWEGYEWYESAIGGPNCLWKTTKDKENTKRHKGPKCSNVGLKMCMSMT